MSTRFAYLLALSALLPVLSGCSAVALNAASTLLEREYVVCPDQVPKGSCPIWRPLDQPKDMLDARADMLEGAKRLEMCRAWHAKRDAAQAACRAEFERKAR